MTVSMRVLTAGEGYRYLLKSVVAGDGDRDLATPLTWYYQEKGTRPGSWLGSGVAGFGAGAIGVGDVVTEDQLRMLLGQGRDPVTGEALGRAYFQFKSAAERLASRLGQLPLDLDSAERAEAVRRIEAEEARGRARAWWLAMTTRFRCRSRSRCCGRWGTHRCKR
ncbi:relaxase domain-containing protein [Jiangella asiatica]|uniref:relaxase domain-containing protein n=1 Tax=Jiangella asiatica TaxID=2530372 RepID=UPI00193EB9FE|nr:relaxase domain-containing protein [Jiangella asiatica]